MVHFISSDKVNMHEVYECEYAESVGERQDFWMQQVSKRVMTHETTPSVQMIFFQIQSKTINCEQLTEQEVVGVASGVVQIKASWFSDCKTTINF